MADSRVPGALGRHHASGRAHHRLLGRHDGAAPHAHARRTGNTPGTLGRGDWADPEHPAFAGAGAAPGTTVMSFTEHEVQPIVVRPHVPTPKPRVGKLPPGVPTGLIKEPAWIKIACEEEAKNVHEMPGRAENNPRILQYIASIPSLAKLPDRIYDKQLKKKVETGWKMSEVDETAWCACFVTWCLKQAGMKANGGATAQGWLKYGTPLPDDAPKVGAITILYHPPKKALAAMTSSGFHVAFYVGGPADQPVLLGGNQSDSVCRKQFPPKFEVRGYRWPIAAH